MSEPRVVIPLIGGVQVTLSGDFPLTEEQWDGLLLIMHVMKPGLVSNLDPDTKFAADIQARTAAAMRPPYEARVEEENHATQDGNR